MIPNPLAGFWANAKKIGFNARQCLVLVLAIAGAWLLHDGIPFLTVCGFATLIYVLNPLEEMARALIANRKAGPGVDRDRREHGRYLEKERKRIESKRPHLPLEPPREGRRADP